MTGNIGPLEGVAIIIYNADRYYIIFCMHIPYYKSKSNCNDLYGKV